jgi:flagellar protein FliO/FliZ
MCEGPRSESGGWAGAAPGADCYPAWVGILGGADAANTVVLNDNGLSFRGKRSRVSPYLSTGLSAAGALAGVLGLIWLFGRGARLAGFASRPARIGRTLSIAEVVPLDARRRLYLIGCRDRQLILLTGPEGDHVLGWLPEGAAAQRESR